MPVINRIADFHAEIAAWRRDFHENPELGYDVHRTAKRVAELLRSFGVDEVVEGIGRTGVVGVIKGKTARATASSASAPTWTRCRSTSAPASPTPATDAGKMHACGHDGHTAMLLGAAKYLAETRNFAGTVAVIFQPAEEGGAGGRAMVEDGLMDRFKHRRGLRHAQHARPPRRHLRHPRRRHHGRERRVHHHHRRAGRSRRACRTTPSIRW